MQVNVGDTVIYFTAETKVYDPSYTYSDNNIGIVTLRHIDFHSGDNAWWATWGSEKNGLHAWFDADDTDNFRIISKSTTKALSNDLVIDELCDLLAEACNEGHSRMQTKTLRRIQMQLKALGKPALTLK